MRGGTGLPEVHHTVLPDTSTDLPCRRALRLACNRVEPLWLDHTYTRATRGIKSTVRNHKYEINEPTRIRAEDFAQPQLISPSQATRAGEWMMHRVWRLDVGA
jgi:hypothetical protein